MSRYVDAVRSARPEHLYIFDLSRADLDGGTIADEGYNPVDATIVEDTGFAELEPVPPLLKGHKHAVKFNVLHDRSVNSPDEYAAFAQATGVADKYFGPDPSGWTIELVVQAGGEFRSRYDSTEEDTDAEGLSFERVDEYSRQFVYRVMTVDGIVEVVRSSLIPNGTLAHAAVTREFDTYSMVVNGVFEGAGSVEGATEGIGGDLFIGGVDSVQHMDSTIALLALYDRPLPSQTLFEHFNVLQTESDYDASVESMDPRIHFSPSDIRGVGAIEPFVSKVSQGADSEDLYEDENGTLRIQPDRLGAGAVTVSKKIKFDLSELTEGVSSRLYIESTTDANSSIDVLYSFDDTTYNTFVVGDDTIPELEIDWGGVV